MRILLIHQNFPGQFRHMAQAWAARPGWEVVAIGRDTAPGLPGVRCLRYRPHRPAGPSQHPYLRKLEDAVLHGQAVARIKLKLRQQGFTPDAIVAHPGWGETLYAKDVFPAARLIHLCEWFYGAEGSDVGFDPEFPASFDDHARIRSWNALHLLNLENCDAGVSPTHWQKSRHPLAYQHKIAVAHEGIDTGSLGPDPQASFTTPAGLTLRRNDPVITYVARNLEPYRGFHQFMRALEIVQGRHATCHAVIVGGDDVSYGKPPTDAPHWREQMLRECRIDTARTHFVGKLPYEQYRRVLQVSAAHVYLSYPFVLSWSMLEAMATGCVVIGSRTAPVEEVIRDGQNGWLVDFFDSEAIAGKVVEVLGAAAGSAGMSLAARRGAGERYSRAEGQRAYDRLLEAEALPRNLQREQIAARGTQDSPTPSHAGLAFPATRGAIDAGYSLLSEEGIQHA